MSEEDDLDASPELQDFIILSIEMGVEILRTEGSLIPMVVSIEDNRVVLCALAVESSEVFDVAAKHVAALPAKIDRYALLFSGKMAIGADTSHAIIVQAAERTGSHGYTVFQAFDPETFDVIGAPEYGGRADQLLQPGQSNHLQADSPPSSLDS